MWTSLEAGRAEREENALEEETSPVPATCWELALQRPEVIAPSRG